MNNRGWNDRREWNLRIADILSIVPEGGEQEQDWMRFAPFGDAFSPLMLVRRFHDLRSFHQRLFTFAPFGDGRMPHAKVQLRAHFKKGHILNPV